MLFGPSFDGVFIPVISLPKFIHFGISLIQKKLRQKLSNLRQLLIGQRIGKGL